jgi:hypothetical protein
MAGKYFNLSDELRSTNFKAATRIQNSNILPANSGEGSWLTE